VYQERSHAAVYFFWAVIAACLCLSPSPAYLALSLGLMLVYVDFYGAVLHVVLDHAPFVDLPIISAGCLEFQWHHAIPSDIVSKPFVEVVRARREGCGPRAAGPAGSRKRHWGLLSFPSLTSHTRAHPPPPPPNPSRPPLPVRRP
jgi:hypothetical protein